MKYVYTRQYQLRPATFREINPPNAHLQTRLHT